MNFLKKHFGLIFLFLVWIATAITNFSPNTFLSGWDTFHPEFNFAVNLKRALFASWQEYQGLGLLGGMGHASDLFRQIILWIFSFVLPLNFLRYFFHFSMLLAGALGIYFLLKDFVLEKYDETAKKWGAIAGAVFYLFNLGTLQMFYLPWESFSAHFGFLPWLFWGVFKYLKEPSKKNLLIFVLINILSVSQGYVATVFLVYVMALCLLLIQIVIPDLIRNLHKLFYRFQTSFDSARDSGMTKRTIIVLLVTFCVNAFWLLPNLYFVSSDVGVNTGAKISQMATENNLLLNKKYGDFKNAALFKGFWFDNVEIQSSGKTDFIMGDWVKHLQNPYIQWIGYSLFGLSLFGILIGLITKNKYSLLFLPVFLLGFIFLANDTPGFSSIAKLLYKLPLFSQIFRFPFTKFSILTAFCEAVFFGVFVSVILDKCHSSESWNLYKLFYRFRIKSGMTIGLIIVFFSLPIVFLFPVFQGKLFYVKEKAKIPSEYFAVFNFFKMQDKNTRIAEFPIPNFWGWTLYDWKKNGMYSGSGFLWYGIEQPILSRNFDMWSGQNENYYWEISYALYSKNQKLFENVLEKYQVNWLLVDGNVINPGAEKALFLDELEEVISNKQLVIRDKPKFELAATFGKIKIYKVNLQTPVKDFVWIGENLPNINSYDWGNNDKAYETYGNYVNAEEGETTYYPFRSLFTGRKTDELEIEIEDLGDRFVFKAKLPERMEDYLIELPENYKGKELVEINPITYETKYFIPTIDSDGKTFSVSFPKIMGLLSFESNENLPVFYLPNLSHQYAYLISAENRNISGKPLLFWIENLTNRKADQEIYLDSVRSLLEYSRRDLMETSKLIQPPMASDGLGYSLHFDNISIGRETTINELGKITVNPIPYQFLTELKLTQISNLKSLTSAEASAGRQNQISNLKTDGIIVNHPNPSIYEVTISPNILVRKDSPCQSKENPCVQNMQNILVLSQAYHERWKAYKINSKIKNQKSKLWKILPFLFGKPLEHVKVNNWENGWKLPSNPYSLTPTTYVIFFWPQYLEYAGFGLLFICLFVIAGFSLRRKSAD